MILIEVLKALVGVGLFFLFLLLLGVIASLFIPRR